MKIRTKSGLVMRLLKPNELVRDGDYISAVGNGFNSGWIVSSKAWTGKTVSSLEWTHLRFARPLLHLCNLPE